MEDISEIRLSKALRDFNIDLDTAIDYLSQLGYNIDYKSSTKIDSKIYNALQEEYGDSSDIYTCFQNSIDKLIAVRGNRKHDDLGYPKPVLFYENEYKTKYLNKDERELIFKNTGYIIVKSNFFEIYEKYEGSEFFVINYEEDKSFIENSNSSIKYSSKDGNTSTVKKLPLIIDGDINKILDTGIVLLPYAEHSFIFIKSENYIYGPISIQQNIEESPLDIYDDPDSYEYSIQPLPLSYFDLDKNYENVIFQFDESFLKEYIIFNRYGKNDSSEYYISNAKHLVENIKPTSFILNESDEDIIELINKQIPESFKNKSDWVSSNASENPITKKRFEKFLALKSKSEKWIQFIDNYISTEYLKSLDGKKEIEKFLSKNEDLYIKEFKKQFEDKIYSELEEESSKLEDARIEKKRLEEEIEHLKDEASLIKSKSDKLLQVEKNLNEKLEKLKLVNKIGDLKEEEDRQDRILADSINKVKKYEEQLQELRDQYSNESEAAMHKKLLDLKPYVDALNGFSPSQPVDEKPIITAAEFYNKDNGEIVTLEEIVDRIKDYLNKNNRIIKTEDITNQITSIQQSFLTVFAGLPGVGKTSLAVLYSKFLTADSTFVDIPVSRGWNSRKNLLGFFNPINDSYQMDEYGFMKLLNQYNLDLIEELTPAITLLDEANLSPMEHYWSDFISISDRNSKERFIYKDGKNGIKINIPSGLRFLSTINSDHTTEVLSPRLIDRGAIIKIPYSKPSSDGLENFQTSSKLHLPESIYSQEQLDSVFKPKKPELNRNEQKILFEIINILNDDKVEYGSITPVSPRKMNMILNYCHTTRNIFFELTGNQLVNLDYAILQHILPLINGQGLKYEKRLETLKNALDEKNLIKSAKELNSILAKGQDYKTFTFF